MYCLARYTNCAQAAINAAGRSRGAAAANSRHHAQRLLSAFDALGPWKADDREPEEEELEEEHPEAAPVRSQPVAKTGQKGNWQSRTDEQRIAAILAELRPIWAVCVDDSLIGRGTT